MFKKKITKQSLAELAKVMPVLSECEMREMVGGVIFFNRSGNYCHGYAGTSDIVRYVESVDMSQFSSMDRDSAERAALGIGCSWSGLSQSEQITMIQMVMGGEFSNLRNTSIQFDNMNDSGNVMELHYRDNSLRISRSDGHAFATFGNMYSTLFHENFHARLLSGYSGTGSIKAVFGELGEEKIAYEAQIRDSSFLNTTIEYRVMTIQCYHNVLTKLGVSDALRISMIMELCSRSRVNVSDVL